MRLTASNQNSRARQSARMPSGPCLKWRALRSPTSPRREASLFNSGPAALAPTRAAGPSFPGWLIRLRDLAIYLNYQILACSAFGWLVMAPSMKAAAALMLSLLAMVPAYSWARLWDPFTRSGGGEARA